MRKHRKVARRVNKRPVAKKRKAVARKPARRKPNMAASTRAGLRTGDFAIPELRKFPIQSEKQAVTALTYAHWPANAKYRARVERAVYDRYPRLRPSAGQKRAGHLVVPKKQRTAKHAAGRIANTKFRPGEYAYKTGELEAVEVLGALPGNKYRVRTVDGISAAVSGGELTAVRRANPTGGGSAAATTLQKQVAHAFAKRWTVTQGQGNFYAYPHGTNAADANYRYRVSTRGVTAEKKHAGDWTPAGKSTTLTAALEKLRG